MTADLATAARILRDSCGDRFRTDVPLAPLTSFRIGGPAALYLEPRDDDDLEAASDAIRSSAIEYVVLGKGSNVLIADAGYEGLVIRLGRGYRWAARDGDRLRAGAAMALPALAGVALSHRLDGLAFAVAIPATVGGAVAMNAGAHGGQMADVCERIDLFELERGVRRTIDANEVGFAYRRSTLPREGVVVGTTLLLRSGDPGEIRAAMDEARAWRKATQPIAEPNCGSVFTNPPGDHAARLIEAAGLKGLRVGGAHVSMKHANFIVAGPGASASDVGTLIAQIRERVADHSGVMLEPEVKVIGGRG
jgi:UDP-N-acetylmuramate dehydrogenase